MQFQVMHTNMPEILGNGVFDFVEWASLKDVIPGISNIYVLLETALLIKLKHIISHARITSFFRSL